MSRTFVLTVAICVWGFAAAVALADKGGPADQAEKAQLLKQIAELKLMLAKLQDVAARQQAAADKARNPAAPFKGGFGEKGVDKGGFGEKGFHKGGPAGPQQAMQRLENIRAAVKHLQAAGLHDVAAAVAKQGDQIQAALKQGQFKGDKPQFFKGDKPQHFKGDKPHEFKKGVDPRGFKGDKPHKPVAGGPPHHLHEMSTAIGRLSKQVEQLQKAVAELQKRR